MRELVRSVDATEVSVSAAEVSVSTAEVSVSATPLDRLRSLASAGLVALVLVATLSRLSTGSAVFVETTDSIASQASTLTVEPPTDVVADLSAGFLVCNALVSWTASVTPNVTGYQVQRINQYSGQVQSDVTVGPNVTQRQENSIGLALIGGGWDWRVRTLRGTWTSEWATATENNTLLCFLL